MNNLKEEYLQKFATVAFKEILSFKESLIFLGVSKSFLYKLTSKKAIKFSKPNNGKLYFKKSDLYEWMIHNEIKSTDVLENEIFEHLNRNGNGKKNN
jgi:excisionase family DNA binding protein